MRPETPDRRARRLRTGTTTSSPSALAAEARAVAGAGTEASRPELKGRAGASSRQAGTKDTRDDGRASATSEITGITDCAEPVAEFEGVTSSFEGTEGRAADVTKGEGESNSATDPTDGAAETGAGHKGDAGCLGQIGTKAGASGVEGASTARAGSEGGASCSERTGGGATEAAASGESPGTEAAALPARDPGREGDGNTTGKESPAQALAQDRPFELRHSRPKQGRQVCEIDRRQPTNLTSEQRDQAQVQTVQKGQEDQWARINRGNQTVSKRADRPGTGADGAGRTGGAPGPTGKEEEAAKPGTGLAAGGPKTAADGIPPGSESAGRDECAPRAR
jgi:hypothetical protein